MLKPQIPNPKPFTSNSKFYSHKLRPWLMPGGDDTVEEVRALFAALIGADAGGGGERVRPSGAATAAHGASTRHGGDPGVRTVIPEPLDPYP
jgi:hypothetical protein